MVSWIQNTQLKIINPIFQNDIIWGSLKIYQHAAKLLLILKLWWVVDRCKFIFSSISLSSVASFFGGYLFWGINFEGFKFDHQNKGYVRSFVCYDKLYEHTKLIVIFDFSKMLFWVNVFLIGIHGFSNIDIFENQLIMWARH